MNDNVRWTAIDSGVRVKGSGGDHALLYQVARVDGDGEWIVEGRVDGRLHSGTFRDEYIAREVLGLLFEAMRRGAE